MQPEVDSWWQTSLLDASHISIPRVIVWDGFLPYIKKMLLTTSILRHSVSLLRVTFREHRKPRSANFRNAFENGQMGQVVPAVSCDGIPCVVMCPGCPRTNPGVMMCR